MQKTTSSILRAALAGMYFFTLASGHAQMPPQNDDAGPRASDPQRWYVNDATRQEQLRTLRKEIGAAYQQAQKECKQMAAPDRAACLKDARNTYKQDMSNAEQLRKAAHPQS
ncbi:MAG TPA: hypothetical protein VGP06_03390 [Janthinobacterium sp.]|jgi:hypothetical protein|nr:hypothetical protein [Janthinobacterium sp.]